ncbi:endoglucanase [Haloferax mucosum ATCC BAA-1512]|uniref:Endoglucanase n=2 Tax=Haloferax mucosum TaxID=403181 RepID=M0I6T9_9EURY|nr:endoglucanase [Haloferax mucosum ATCC BAA-1512]
MRQHSESPYRPFVRIAATAVPREAARSPGTDGLIYNGNSCKFMDFDFDRLKQLTETSGVPGYEDRIRALVREDLEATTDEVRVDAMGNVVGTIEGTSDFEVAVAAHMDEIGFMVRHINDDGFVQLDALGGWDPRVLKAQRVTIHTEDEDLTGVIGSVPPHTLTEEQKKKDPKVEDVYVDVGLPAETVEETVSVGDLVTMEQTTVEMGDHVTGKAIDDRVCLFAMLEAARRIENPEVTIHFAATVQEEVGLRGAQALGVDLNPDLALGLDTTVANDVPGFDPADFVTELGEGAGIKLKDSSAIANPKVHRRLRDVAEEHEIDYQMELLPAGGTDTGGFQNTYGAKPVGAVSMPTRYLHTVTESVHKDDVVAYIDLLTAFLESETGDFDYTL